MITPGRSMSRWRIAVVASVVSLGAVAVWLARDPTPPPPRGGGIPSGSVVVPDLAGLEGTALRRVLHGVGLRLEGVRLVGRSEPLYTLVRQRPSAGTVVPEGSGVVVTLSTRGPGYTIGCPVLTGLVPAGEGDEPRVLRFVRRYLRVERRPSPDRAFLWRSLDPYWRAVLSEDGGPRPGTHPVPREFRSFRVSEAAPLTRPGRLNGGLRWQLGGRGSPSVRSRRAARPGHCDVVGAGELSGLSLRIGRAGRLACRASDDRFQDPRADLSDAAGLRSRGGGDDDDRSHAVLARGTISMANEGSWQKRILAGYVRFVSEARLEP